MEVCSGYQPQKTFKLQKKKKKNHCYQDTIPEQGFWRDDFENIIMP